MASLAKKIVRQPTKQESCLAKQPRLAVQQKSARQISWLVTSVRHRGALPSRRNPPVGNRALRHIQLRGQPKNITSFPFNPYNGTVQFGGAYRKIVEDNRGSLDQQKNEVLTPQQQTNAAKA